MRRQTRLGKTIATVSTLTRAGGPQSSDVCSSDGDDAPSHRSTWARMRGPTPRAQSASSSGCARQHDRPGRPSTDCTTSGEDEQMAESGVNGRVTIPRDREDDYARGGRPTPRVAYARRARAATQRDARHGRGPRIPTTSPTASHCLSEEGAGASPSRRSQLV